MKEMKGAFSLNDLLVGTVRPPDKNHRTSWEREIWERTPIHMSCQFAERRRLNFFLRLDGRCTSLSGSCLSDCLDLRQSLSLSLSLSQAPLCLLLPILPSLSLAVS